MASSILKLNRVWKVVGGMVVVGILAAALFGWVVRPWYMRWGATDAEVAATYLGDDLVPQPARIINRAVTIQATPEQIYPWIVQLGAGKGGYYSYTWLETYLLNCPIVNADRIHPEWQNLEVGDPVKMCPGDFGPPPYEVALIGPLYTIVLGHTEDGRWMESWQFVIEPQPDGASRLILRTRSLMVGGFWDIIEPGTFIMERGMLLGIKERAEALARQ